ncbi:acetyl/propionyl/methylcrotonyl-CoA carboxylase subunit alpha [Oxalobacteraceae bacterium]|nr:acetyl/propionyl/methylcrotonyl-CoA carboxylase subunit alpha [Oxalobacteraceae bacterium]
MFTKILIANRGEIACRVAATARRMGIKTVAVYSEADAGAAHVAACDEAVLIGPAAAKESYLRGEKIIAVAKATGAQAIHPGYGFLSENAEFADACAEAGLVFIGPPASAMRAMGSKSAAKTLMESAKVPLVPGYHGENQDADYLHKQADSMGYPVLLKASAGGGGKGMRVIDCSDDFKAALASCKREAISSFGDDKVLAEKYLQRPRHIEIQVFADTLGNCIYLFERDCSVQRRHQKVLEEAPAPNMTQERRAAMGEAAVAAARAVGYVGAGTVEFIVNQDGTFYFMEMNTRLQVEHPVTEMITGTDLVEWQLRVAAGLPLPKQQHELAIHGHAIEARIYAENPEKGFLPSIGTLRHMATPGAVTFELGMGNGVLPAAVRIDSGVRQGDAISPFYDPMIAKLIVWGADRAQALARMAQALAEYRIVGLSTNVAFLKRLVEGQAFSQAELDTGLIERNQASLFPPAQAAADGALALAAVALIEAEKDASAAQSGAHSADPWGQALGWRLNNAFARTLSFGDEYAATLPAKAYGVRITYRASDWLFEQPAVAGDAPRVLSLTAQNGHELSIRLGDQAVHGTVLRDGELLHVFTGGRHYPLSFNDPMAHAGESEAEGGRLTAPMPGKVVAVLASKGQQVTKGDPLVIMEAMKMEHTIAAPHDGVVEDILYNVGDQVADGAPLLAFKAA